MRINKLELFGFKSFPDRTAFEFGSGISCVVGPNGSGKSNVVDALRWVIGEQSARSLRGKEMSDVIFAGSSVRSPVGFAEVVLTLGVGDGEPFPGDFARFEELEVGRRLYRDGTSEYLINRVKARRRDIVDLFLDTGVGANLYSFIAQGQVDRIVSQSPNERRSLIDEAAGISRYKVRREEALARLKATGTQLDRAADVADEMGRRLRTLERQVLRAGRFRRARAKIKQREIALGVVKYAALAGDRRALRQKLRRAKDEVGALERSIERIQSDLNAREEELNVVRGAVSTWRDQAAELEARRREQEGAASLHRSRHDELMAEAGRAKERRAKSAERQEAARGAREAAGQEVRALEAKLVALQLDDLVQANDAARGKVDTQQGEVHRLTAEVAKVEAQRRALEKALMRVAEPGTPEVVPELPDVEGPQAAVAVANDALEKARAEEERLATVLEDVRASIRAARAAQDARVRAHRQEEADWRARRDAVEAEEKRLVKEARRAVRLAEEASKRAHQTERKRQLERLATWTRAWRRKVERDRARIQEDARTALRRLDRERSDRLKSAEAEERRRVKDAREAVDVSAVVEAESALQDAAVSQRRADAEHTRSKTEHTAAVARQAALDAEWKVLEEQRAASVPAAWQEHPLFDATADAEDPRRTARPDLLGLPVLGEQDLQATEGRGIWPAAAVTWRLVDTLEEAVAALAVHGPPVASRDGAIRVDADGVVELGWNQVSRWSVVRGEREQAAADVMATRAVAEQAREAQKAAEQRVQDTRRALVVARKAVEEAQQRAVVEARAAVEAERIAQREREAVERRAVEGHKAAEEARLEQERARAEAELARVREHVEAQEWHAPPVEPMALAAAAACWPTSAGPRPAPLSLDPIDEAPVREAELAVKRARQAVETAQRDLRGAQDALAAVERRRDALEVRREALQAAATRRGAERKQLQDELQALPVVHGVPEAEAALEEAKARAEAARRELVRRQEDRAALREAQAMARATEKAQGDQEEAAAEDGRVAVAELDRAERAAVEALAASKQAREAAERHAIERADVMARLTVERDRLGKLVQESMAVKASLEKNRKELTTQEASRVDLDARVKQLQLEIEALRKRLGDRYQVSLPGLLDRLQMRKELVLPPDEAVQVALTVGTVVLEPVETLSFGVSFLDDEERVVDMVDELEGYREVVSKLGEVNLAAEGEYRELAERYADLDRQRNDLEASVKSIRAAIAKMNRTCRERFRDAYDRVNEAFQIAYPELVGGGDARLALTDEEDLLETGVDIFVRPPGKRLQNLTLLSGGEKAMTAIALLLAIFKVRPSPFCVLDEVDAPLDEANGSRFNNMIREMSTMSQFIVITHNRKTMECADVLYGVTMASPGVSTLVSVALEHGHS